MFFKSASGILGMNARNLLYVSKYNSTANKKFADDKIFTKKFLGSRAIGVARLYQIVKTHTQLTHEFFLSLPNAFVIKPNKGFGGGGILVINETEKHQWITASRKTFAEEDLVRHCFEILEGKYSISGVHDQVIFEEKLDPHPDFRTLTTAGLSDIRVIVFNGIPTIAMLRVPTLESEGKGNMELGAIAMGIDIGTGKTTGGAYYSNYIRKLPNGESAIGFQVPYWDEILLTVAKIQNVTKIGFLGVDLVITQTEVKVLELNARAGLKIQIANKTPLRARLEKIADLKVISPEEGVKVAKTLFSEKAKQLKKNLAQDDKPIIGVLEPVIFYGAKPQTLTAKIDLLAEKNSITSSYFDGSMMDISIVGKRLKLPVEKSDILNDVDLVLSGKFLGDFYVDPSKKLKKDFSLLTATLDEKMIKNIDIKVCELEEKIKLLAYFNPQNLEEQKALFLSQKNQSPRFIYRAFKIDFERLRSELKKIPRDVDHFLAELYNEKMVSIEARINLLEARDSEEFSVFSKQLFGEVSQGTYKSALKFLKDHADNLLADTSPELEPRRAIEMLQEFLDRKKLIHWKIKVIESSVADIQITKENTILLKKNATFQENRLKALLVHEIGTHVFRYENGKLQPFRILERGTANYLRTEEGLAIWNQNQLHLDLGEKYLTPALLIVAIFMAEKMSFSDLFQFLLSTHNISIDLAWKLCVKSKRGLQNTKKQVAFTKDCVYFKGHKMIERFIKNGGAIDDLYVGKIDIEDLSLMEQINDLKPAKFLL